MSELIPLSAPSIKGNEWAYIKECLDTEWVSSVGKFVDRFESEISTYTGAKYSIACINGTAALHTALLLLGVSSDDEVIVPTITFIAPVNAIRYVGAYPIFMDCDRNYNIDVDKLEEFLREETVFKDGHSINKITRRRIAAIIPVHVFGNAVRMDRLCHIADQFNLKVIEDATESLGTRYNQICHSKHTGTVGDIGCFSFNGNKIITTGGGGMIVTDNPDYAKRARYLTTQSKDDQLRFIHNEIGFNYRLTNLQAALGVAQIEQLPKFIQIKRDNFNYLKSRIDHIPGLSCSLPPQYADNNLWMYPVQIEKELYGLDRDELIGYLNENNIQTRPIWYLNHKQKPYLTCQTYRIETAYKLFDITINIPCSVSLTKVQMDRIVDTLELGHRAK